MFVFWEGSGPLDIEETLRILSDAAKYDVACTSSGVGRSAKAGSVGYSSSGGICHAFSSDGRCVSLLKVLLTNKCAYDCAYCASRASNERPRAQFTPRELAELTIGFYRRNCIEGLFLSSAVLRDPDYTVERMIEALELLRGEYRFNGYIHAKGIPGASPALMQRLGQLADRVSVNIELPSRESLAALAPQKSTASVAQPMGLIRDGIAEAREDTALARRQGRRAARRFAPAGQATQMIIGATPESDLHILRLSKSLYQRFNLKRVFFSAYLSVNESPLLPTAPNPPLEREHRLYQADWLMRFYSFDADELVDEQHPFLDPQLDPKCVWALSHMDCFPVEVNSASYELLLRVPGIGPRGAAAIVRARKSRTLSRDDLKRLKVSVKRARFFITCNGRYDPSRTGEGPVAASSRQALSLVDDPARLRAALVAELPGRDRLGRRAVDPGQLSLFEVPGFTEDSAIPVTAAEPASWRRMARRIPSTASDDAWFVPGSAPKVLTSRLTGAAR